MPPDQEQVKQQVVQELLEFGLVDEPDSIEYIQSVMVPTGQIVYDLQRRDVLGRVNRYLDSVGVLRVGRYSEWKYLMSDACVLGGRRTALRLRDKSDDTDWEGVAITDSDVPDEVASKSS